MLGDDAAKLGSHISPSGMLDAICVMAVTFVIVFLYTLRTLHFSNPIELLSGAKKGEKEPKTKLFMTIIGVLFVISGYTLSFFVSEPKEDLMMLMLAVLLVILGTYCIFVAGKLKRDQIRTIELVHIDRMSSRDVKGADDDILFKKEVEFHAGKGEVAVLSGSADYSPSEVELLGRKYKVSMLEYSATPGKTTTIGLSSNEEILDLIKSYNEKSGLKCKQDYYVEINYNDGADKTAENEKIRSVIERIGDRVFDEPVDESKNERITTVMQAQFRSEDKSAMMLAYGSLFFLGVFLGTLFVLETILIVYYKQLTEGYEDADRFKIMQNVGMSEEEVRSSIRSQILLVFFLPLIVAVIHTIFAFPMVGRLLSFLGLESTKIYLRSCLFGFIGYTVLYTVIYVLTAKLYYSIIKKQN